jgi:large subunit ribosomal protein L21
MGRLLTWRTPIYAIVRAGGRQYRVEPNQTLDVDRIEAQVGSTVDLSVLLVGGNGDVSVGTPEVADAKVVAEIIEHGRGKKVLVFKYKNKTRYRRRHGHRQDYTRLQIKEIVTEAGSYTQAAEKPKRAAPKRPRRKKAEAVPEPVEAEVTETPAAEAAAPEAEAPEAQPEAAVETEEKPKATRRRASRKAPAAAEEPAEAEAAAEPEAAAEGEAVAAAKKAPEARRSRRVVAKRPEVVAEESKMEVEEAPAPEGGEEPEEKD